MRRFRDVWMLGLVLGLSGCAGMQQRLASHPADPERPRAGALATRGGRPRHQATEPPRRSPGDPSTTKVAAKAARPPRVGLPLFPRPGPTGRSDPIRPDPLGVRASATPGAGSRPASGTDARLGGVRNHFPRCHRP